MGNEKELRTWTLTEEFIPLDWVDVGSNGKGVFGLTELTTEPWGGSARDGTPLHPATKHEIEKTLKPTFGNV